MQHAGGMLLPPVQKLVATIIFISRGNEKADQIPPRTNQKGERRLRAAAFIGGDGGDLNRFKCNMPVACCCHQFKNWWLP